jgi:hypothetical protein
VNWDIEYKNDIYIYVEVNAFSEALSAPAVWTFSCVYSNRPKGEQRTAQALRPGKAYGKKIALKGRPTSGRYSQEITFGKTDSMAFQKL